MAGHPQSLIVKIGGAASTISFRLCVNIFMCAEPVYFRLSAALYLHENLKCKEIRSRM